MNTHLSQFYGTNHVPSDAELFEIEQLLAPHKARLLQLEMDLEEAETKIARLKKEREYVLRVMKPLKALSSLAYLQHMLCAVGLAEGLQIMEGNCVDYTQVVDLDGSRYSHSPTSSLERQKAAKLTTVPRACRPMAGTVRKLPPFHCHFDPESNPFMYIDPESLPILKHVRFSATSYPFDNQNRLNFQGFLSAPNLKTLHIQGSHLYRTISVLPVNWTNLTLLSIEGPIGALFQPERLMVLEILSILWKCRKLRIFSLLLEPTLGHNQVLEPQSQITLPDLEALNVTGCRLQIHYLLQSIKAPRLREIHYQPYFKPARTRVIATALPLSSFLQQYGHQIEVLSFNFPSISKENVGSWLECTPALKQLTLGHGFQFAPPPPRLAMEVEDRPFDDSCIALLTPKQDQPYLCPNLKIFRSSIQSLISAEALLAFLNARIDPLLVGSIIEEVSIHQLPYDAPFAEPTDAEDERLTPIREAGVRLSFKKMYYYHPNTEPPQGAGPTGTFES
ncbi:hypothetical protein EST38_g3766 [Candolleomyces aberdarensis]|uniref:Uncharacterized protein n=1 Tax=Candolleomyces aberdarensis TaxID=2316362 RepID=A0A4Q2DPL0_9AGAR|nr:hypothetical protein EST38_g3766 [Candolleomyces aberdarensis]